MQTYTINNEEDFENLVCEIPQGIVDRVPEIGNVEPSIKEELEYINLNLNFEWAQEYLANFGVTRKLTPQELKEYILWLVIGNAQERRYEKNQSS